ncbi:MAG: hypothetical protein CRN43_14765 [Candidatus Nephrothrix sp. EaCA]|nr:MAG: hypothetical protein CRN43_14765 [Candidatus Nephrothrix sp. EaCA]
MFFRRLYRLINWLSIDVMLGAMASAVFFLRISGIALSRAPILLLGLSVWVIYVADHLLDAQHIGQAHTLRHRFHRRHFMSLLIALFAVLSVIGVSAFFVRLEILGGGILMMMLVALYFILRSYFGFIKEIGIALLFCAGVLFPSIADGSSFWKLFTRWEVFSFIDIVLINVMIFSWYEYEDDVREGFNSFAVRFGKGVTRYAVNGLFGLQALILWRGLYADFQLYPFLILFSMATALMIVFVFPKYFQLNERFRLLGDSVFLFPIFILTASFLRP